MQEKPKPVYAEPGQARAQALRMVWPIVCRRLEEFPKSTPRSSLRTVGKSWHGIPSELSVECDLQAHSRGQISKHPDLVLG